MSRSLAVVAALLFAALSCTTAPAAERVALVIGNSAYQNVSPLPNPARDARAIADALQRLGFEVSYRQDLGFDEMRRVLLDFGDKAAGADEVAVYYAGHGMEIDKQNFLVPVDARLATDRSVAFEAVPLDLVLSAVEGARHLKMVVIDACRNNPFAAGMKRTNATRSIGRGLSRVEPSTGTLVAYSAKEGTVADDGERENSPYAAALLRYLEEPGLEINLMFRKVRDEVLAETGNRQEPFTYGSLPGESIFLVPPVPAAADGVQALAQMPAPATSPPAAVAAPEDREAWNGVKDTESIAILKSFADRYPQSLYADFARARIAELEAEAAARSGAEVAALPAPEPAPAAAEAAPDLTPILTDFVERRYLRGDIGDVGTLLSNYAAEVDYYGKGVISQSDVIADKLAYARKWPVIDYRLVPGTLRFEPMGGTRYFASFTYAFKVASAKRQVSGTAVSRLVLDVAAGDPRIVGESGEVLARE